MKSFDVATLERIVFLRYPGTSSATARALAFKAKGDPNLLHGFLRLRDITRTVDRRHGAIRLGDTDIAALSLPRSTSQLLERLRSEFPEALRSIIRMSSVDRAILIADWLLEATSALIGVVDDSSGDQSTGTVYAWIESIDTLIRNLYASIPEEWVVHPNRNSVPDGDIRTLRWAIIDRLVDERDSDAWDDRDPQVRIALLRRLHAVSSEFFVDEEFDMGCRIELAILEAGEGQFAEAVNLLEGRLPPDVHLPVLVMVRSYLTEWLMELGRTHEAVELCRHVVEGWIRYRGPEHPDTLGACFRLARALGLDGQIEEAIAVSRSLVIDHTRVFGADDFRTLAVRCAYAIWMCRSGEDEDAIEHLRQIVVDYERVCGPENRDTLWARSNLAFALVQAGYDEEADEIYGEILKDMSRILGVDHPDTSRLRDMVFPYERREEDPD